MTTVCLRLRLFLCLTILTTASIRAELVSTPPNWVTIILDKEIFGSSPPWNKIEELRRIVEQLTGDHNTWDATADIAEVGIETTKLLSKYPTAQKTTGEIKFGQVLYTNVTFYHYGPIAFGAKDGAKTISFLIAPRYFYQKGFLAIAAQQKEKPFDFTKVNGADDKDISIQQLVGSWVSYQSVMWRFQTNRVLFHGPEEYFVLGNRIISDGQTVWKMVLKTNTLELWGVDYSLLSLRHKLYRKPDRHPK